MNQLRLLEHRGIRGLFHVPSGRFFELTGDLYNRMDSYINNDKAYDTKVNEALEFLNKLPQMEKPKFSEEGKLKRLSLLSSQSCNLKCNYCFANHGNYTEKQDSYMSMDVYKKSLEYLLSKYTNGITLIQFFGGEPLLSFNEIKEFVPYCIEIMEQRGLPIPSFSIVTNGTIFTDEIIDFLNQYNISVTISLDGPKEINDSSRISEAGWSVFDKVSQNMKYLSSKRKFPLIVEVTLNKQHVTAYKPGIGRRWMEEIHNMGFDGGIVGVAETNGDSLSLSSEDEWKYKEMYRELVDYFFDRLKSDKPFCCFDVLGVIRILMKKAALVMPCGAGSTNLTVTAKGDILPCYLLYGFDEFKMGNVFEMNSSAFNRVNKVFKDVENQKPEECRECWLVSYCSLWCRGFGYTSSSNLSAISKSRCWTAEAMFEGVMTNLMRIKKEPEEYKSFCQNVIKLSKNYMAAVK